MHEPPVNTVERWAWDFILGTSLAGKRQPPPVPEAWEENTPARRIRAPGRPPELRIVKKAGKTRGLHAPSGRARALHTFFHHEMQAAELMAWALLAFPETPVEFRRGLIRIALDEVRHMGLYAREIARLGYHVGDFTVRDWFWERIPSASDPASFVAAMGLGLEGANLEHSAAFARHFREAGDEACAQVQDVVGREEIAHVRFGVHWFQVFTGSLTFDSWRLALPKPLSPVLMRGRDLEREARMRAGMSQQFLDELEAWQPDTPGY